MTLIDLFSNHLEITNPNASVSMADLAIFTTFDPSLARLYDTAVHCVAADALQAGYPPSDAEITSDFYDGFAARFSDDSTLTYRH